MSIEIFNGSYAARQWSDVYGDLFVETAVTKGAIDWELKRTAWGIVFEVSFKNEAYWLRFRNSDEITNALDTAPDPAGILIYRGRSLDGGTTSSRKPKPKAGSGANALRLPFEAPQFFEPIPAFFSDAVVDRRTLTSTT